MAETHQVEDVEKKHGLEPRQYVYIGIILTVITAIELFFSYADIADGIIITVLLSLSAVKFAMVLALFMHLYFDSVLFTRIFVGSLALGAAVLLSLAAIFAADLTDIVG